MYNEINWKETLLNMEQPTQSSQEFFFEGMTDSENEDVTQNGVLMAPNYSNFNHDSQLLNFYNEATSSHQMRLIPNSSTTTTTTTSTTTTTTTTNNNNNNNNNIINSGYIQEIYDSSSSDVAIISVSRRRKVNLLDSESDDDESMDITTSNSINCNTNIIFNTNDSEAPNKGRRNIRKLFEDTKLSALTVNAEKLENDRLQRIREKKQSLSELLECKGASITSTTPYMQGENLVLEYEKDSKEPLVKVDESIVKQLKPHQRDGVHFLWDCVAESLEMLKSPGSGALLAHCMGLGKTLQIITLIHTLLTNTASNTIIQKCLILMPVNVLYNWKSEFEKWTPKRNFIIYTLNSKESIKKRVMTLNKWHRTGGVLICGYEMFRNLTEGKVSSNKSLHEDILYMLCNPGADLVVCDEGHVMRNYKSRLSKSLKLIKTRRRIVLTGTPLQNNLLEYFCMVDFIMPNLFGSRLEFCNGFVNPITNGQHADSTRSDVMIMKQRSHVLHEKLSGCVQRQDYTALTKYLPPKNEFIISVRLTPLQIQLYQNCLKFNISGGLFSAYTFLRRVWSHPWILKMKSASNNNKIEVVDRNSEMSEDELKPNDHDSKLNSLYSKFSNNGLPNPQLIINSYGEVVLNEATLNMENHNGKSSNEKEWFDDFIPAEIETQLEQSAKLIFLFELLKETKKLNEKVLVFSQSLQMLDLVEFFLQRPENGCWVKGLHYYRMDGSTSIDTRDVSSSVFNNPDYPNMRLFIISTKAGSLGINLIAANRVVILDASWNPSHDTQSIFRVYRFGQTKPVFVYRLIAKGTMEEKIYDRQVTKESLSLRVVDEQQIGRHFTSRDLAELFYFDPMPLIDWGISEFNNYASFIGNPEEAVFDSNDVILIEDTGTTSNKPPFTNDVMIIDPINPSCSNFKINKIDLTKRPKVDIILSNLLDKLQPKFIMDYHEHNSLTEHIYSEELTENEKKEAWENYMVTNPTKTTYSI